MRVRRLLAIFSLISLTLIVPSLLSAATRGISVVAKTPKGQSQKIQLYDYTAALIIGIDRYENLGVSELLTYAVKDAEGVEKVLRDGFQFDEIITLYNEQATRDKIMQALYGFRSLTPDGGVFVYFAGHGITIPSTLRGKDLGYLVPYDGSLNSSEMYKNISMQQVKSDICVSISAKHVFFIFDACFAGLMLDTRATLIKPSRDFSYLKAITDEQVRQVLTAGSKGETVLDGGPGAHSVFTGRLIQALENAEDYITARELGQYLKKRVYGDAAARGHTQRPVDGEIYGTGDFVFVPDLEKKRREISTEVAALQTELARLKRLKEEAAQSKDQAREREIDRQKLIKDAELKQAQIRRRQKEEAVKRQRQAALEVERLDKDRKQREAENEQRLAMLRMQADKMRQELSQDLTGGTTIESAVAELRKIKGQRDSISLAFSTEIIKQTQSLSTFYDKKISRIMAIPPRDKEFETEKDYQARVAETERKATPVRQAKEQKLAALRDELETVRDDQIKPLGSQMKALQGKRFIIPASQVSFKFRSYKLEGQIMLGDLTINGTTVNFYVPIPKAKAREYKYHPELLAPEVLFRANLDGKKFDKVIFHGPGENETYKSLPGRDISDDGRYIAYANGIVRDMKTGLEWKAGSDRDTNWNVARSWVQGLYLDGGGWRMPNMDELASLYKEGFGSQNMTPFLETTGWYVWSGETKDSSRVRDFNFYSGLRYWDNRGYSISKRAFAVRSRDGRSKAIPGKTIRGKLFVKTDPKNSRVRILSIKPKFYQGMELDSGSYHVEVSNTDYKTKKMWVELEAGENKRLEVRLEQLQASIYPTEKVVPPPPGKRLYDLPLALYREGNYEEAITGFKSFVRKFPKSNLADNAQYWVGESHMALKQYEHAILAFQVLIKKYPKGNKVPKAVLRQALAFYEIRDKTSARLLLRKLIMKYPKSSEAKIAKAKLRVW